MTTEITDGTAKFKVLAMKAINTKPTKIEESGVGCVTGNCNGVLWDV